MSSAAIMKFLRKMSAACLLSIGFLFAMYGVAQLPELANEEQTHEEKLESRESFFMSMGLSLPRLAGGGLMLWRLHQKNKKQVRDRLDTIFYRTLKLNQGKITILEFAMETKLSGEEARKYLDTKAKEFNAHFETNDRGHINYHFEVPMSFFYIPSQID